MRVAVISLLLLWGSISPLVAEPVRVATRFGDHPLTELPLSVIRLGLAHAPEPRELEIVHLPEITQKRILTLLEGDSPDFDLYFAGHSPERAERFQQVSFPLTQGLLGLRVLVVRPDSEVPTDLDTLKNDWTLGSGLNWLDTQILENGGFQVFESTYANLWPMLHRGRIEAFPRGIGEAFVEIDQQAEAGRAFRIAEHWLLAYPADFFIYLNRSDQELAAQLEAGLASARASGALDELYRNHPTIKQARQWLNHTDYQLVWLDNPLINGQLPAIPQRYWIPARHFSPE